MSDCRFGVSPVNYPDPDPDSTIVFIYFYMYHIIIQFCHMIMSWSVTLLMKFQLSAIHYMLTKDLYNIRHN